ncbi:hypothetical protein [Sphingobacterium faecale]|uniref:Uncharacterized protein n=1 Tax=Sphingobacterium faecale TaxID=2803775 RepID=A0ABS1RBQ3_9SPHI|nr:hypothetical protein [Sphingobacterium faecale]MBL1411457.1 hypothetical protein [Sphingobacterium faecale]
MKTIQKTIALYILAISTIMLSSTSCSKDKENTPTPEMKSVVHIIGADDENESAVYWKDGKPTILGNEDIKLERIMASGNDIYIVGIENGFYREDRTAIYWKNGMQVDLTELSKKYTISEINIADNSTYMAGRTIEDRTPVFWKNNELPIRLEIPDNSFFRDFHGIEVIEDNCYVLGTISNRGTFDRVMLWKNGKALQITDGTNYIFKPSLYKYDDKIFITGEERLDDTHIATPTVWNKDGQATRFRHEEENILISRIITDGKIMHSVGLKFGEGSGNATYWKNGKEVWSSADNAWSESRDIHIDGEDMYVSGFLNGIPTVWKNGKPTALSTTKGLAYRILITKEPVEK